MSLTCFLILITLVGRTGNILFNVFLCKQRQARDEREESAKQTQEKRETNARKMRGARAE